MACIRFRSKYGIVLQQQAKIAQNIFELGLKSLTLSWNLCWNTSNF